VHGVAGSLGAIHGTGSVGKPRDDQDNLLYRTQLVLSVAFWTDHGAGALYGEVHMRNAVVILLFGMVSSVSG
jgi:hypothetical protein